MVLLCSPSCGRALIYVSLCYQVSLQGLEHFLCLFHYVQHHPNQSNKDALKFW